ncbi:MAG TPA: DUF2520 domain-containing protein [Parasegetibacter sp.]
MRIVIIGSGNIATTLGKLISRAGHTIVEVRGRNEADVKNLAGALGANAAGFGSPLPEHIDIYIAALSDTALYELPQLVKIDSGFIVHTAGSVSRRVLDEISRDNGVLYPLQSLRKEMEQIPPVPILTDASSPEKLELLNKFASGFSMMVHPADDETRAKLHVAAVLSSNFTNYLYAKAHEYCSSLGVPFELLYPLIDETANRIKTHEPEQVMTGPAVRRDEVTINKHLEWLSEFPEIRKIYDFMSKMIMK